jgi:hypothetical protein
LGLFEEKIVVPTAKEKHINFHITINEDEFFVGIVYVSIVL